MIASYRLQLLALLLISSVSALHCSAQQWTRFRGPNGTGVNSGASIPSHWTDKDIHWSIELPGRGHSSPVIWANKIFVTSADLHAPKLHLSCINTGNGQPFWQKDFDLVPYPLHQYNTFATSTPTVDAKAVYLTWLTRGHYMLGAFDHSGQQVWVRDLGSFESQHGSGASPIVYNDMVFATKDPDGESFMIAVNAADGTTRWQTPLHGTRADYATPCLYQTGSDDPAVLVFTSMDDGVLALDPATGHKAWQLDKVFSLRCVSSPVLASGVIVGSCGSGGGGNYVAAVRPPDKTSSHKPELAYTIRKAAPYVPTSVAVGQWLFLWSEAGIVSCLEAPTGAVKWQERVGGNYFASPICIDGRLFGVSTTGQVVVLEASDTFHELARNTLPEGTQATPAVDGGRLYIRTFEHLISIGGSRN
jgi:outer membrane protein assembly factor BamB